MAVPVFVLFLHVMLYVVWVVTVSTLVLVVVLQVEIIIGVKKDVPFFFIVQVFAPVDVQDNVTLPPGFTRFGDALKPVTVTGGSAGLTHFSGAPPHIPLVAPHEFGADDMHEDPAEVQTPGGMVVQVG